MRFRRPRFTVRWLMIAVAVAAFTIWGASWTRRKYREAVASHEKSLIYHRTNASLNRFVLDTKPPHWVPSSSPLNSPARLDSFRRDAEYHEAMILKYERALRLPWLPVPADPPEPR